MAYNNDDFADVVKDFVDGALINTDPRYQADSNHREISTRRNHDNIEDTSR